MAKDAKRTNRIRDTSDIGHWINVLNNLFDRAGIDVRIIELAFAKEQVVIGFPQIESLENEVKVVESAQDFELGGRYLAAGLISSGGREIPTFTRFYLTSDGKLKIEDSRDNGATLVDVEEVKRPELRERVVRVIKNALPWIDFAIKQILTLLGVISRDLQ